MVGSSIWAPKGETGDKGPPGDKGPTGEPGAAGGNVPTMASYAAVRTGVIPGGSLTIFVAGRNVAGDGGGGTYAVVTGDTTSVDNNGTMLVGLDGRRWRYISHSLASNNLYEEFSEVTDRFADRSFFGGATRNNGRNEIDQTDWVTQYQISKGRTAGFIQNTQVAIASGYSTNSQNAANALLVAARTSSLYDNYNAIGIVGLATTDKLTGTGYSYGGYFEGYRESGATGGTYGIEVDTINYGSLVNTDPYIQGTGQSIGLQLASGGEYSPTNQNPSTSAINIQYNGSRFYRGIVFGFNSLVRTNDETDSAIAIAFAKGHRMQWFAKGADNSPGLQTSSIRSTSTAAATSLSQEFGDNYVSWAGPNGSVFAIESNTNTVNYLGVRGQAAGLPIQMLARGSDVNIDLQLVPKGTGGLRLGDYTAGALSPTGYITVKDSGGTPRRLLVG